MRRELAAIIIGIGVAILFLILEITVESLPHWLIIAGFVISGFLIIGGFVGFFWPLRKERVTDTPRLEHDVKKQEILIRNLRNIATDNTNVKIKFVHAKYRPLADTLISVFELAGWKTNLTKVPLESWLHDYITGTEVSGYNKHLVESVAKFLSDAGMIDVRAQVATEQYKHDNPTKQQWVREYIKIVIGH